MKVIDGNFGDKKEEDIDAPTFLATLALRSGFESTPDNE